VSHDTLIRFVFFVYFLMFIHLRHKDTAIMLSVSKYSNVLIKIDIALRLLTNQVYLSYLKHACNLYIMYFPGLYF